MADFNTTNEKTLVAVGVPPIVASIVCEEREINGPYRSWSDLLTRCFYDKKHGQLEGSSSRSQFLAAADGALTRTHPYVMPTDGRMLQARLSSAMPPASSQACDVLLPSLVPCSCAQCCAACSAAVPGSGHPPAPAPHCGAPTTRPGAALVECSQRGAAPHAPRRITHPT